MRWYTMNEWFILHKPHVCVYFSTTSCFLWQYGTFSILLVACIAFQCITVHRTSEHIYYRCENNLSLAPLIRLYHTSKTQWSWFRSACLIMSLGICMIHQMTCKWRQDQWSADLSMRFISPWIRRKHPGAFLFLGSLLYSRFSLEMPQELE